MAADTLLIILLWLLWAATAAEFGIAANGYLTERREGLEVSVFRFLTVGGILAVATVLAIVTPTLPSQSTITPAAPLPSFGQDAEALRLLADKHEQQKKITGELEAIKSERSEAEKRRTELQKQDVDLRNEIDRLQGRSSFLTRFIRSVEQFDRPSQIVLSIMGLVTLAFAGFTILLLGGQLQTLLPEGWALSGLRADRKKIRQQIDAVAAATWDEKYRDALEKADAIPDGATGRFDQLDLKFLRGYCCLQLAAFPAPEVAETQRQSLINRAISDLRTVTEQAPKRGDATYALAVAYGLADKNDDAFETFERAKRLVRGIELPFDHNESVCLLKLAEFSLSTGNTEQAEAYFARVAGMGKLTDAVVQARIRIGVIDLRGALVSKGLANAESTLRKIAEISGLNVDQKSQIDVISSALNALSALQQGDPERALTQAGKFLDKHLPTGLPAPNDDLVDEPFSPVLDADLAFPRPVYHGFLFIQAIARSRLETKRQLRLSEAQVMKLAEPLLRALQFVPRHREVLGALGGLYYWFRPDKRDEAREWLEAAVTMGVRSQLVRLILERDRLVEADRRRAIDLFRSASARMLRDPTVSNEMRRALVEELGRFQEFQPMLISLQAKPEQESEAPTIEVLRERSQYLSQLVANVARGGQSERFQRLAKIQTEYTACLAQLEQLTQSITALERRAFGELGDALILS
jgi:tetratricopeptide (TPR) repeat protein